VVDAIPFRPVPDSVLERIRDGLIRAPFDPRSVCERTGHETMFEIRPLREERGARPLTGIDDALDVLVRLFVDGDALDPVRVERLLPPQLREDAMACGILRRS
jgi:hypothetical protein